VKPDASGVKAYLAELPAERRATMEAVLRLVRRAMPKGFVETASCGMIVWEVPLAVYPDTYNGHPLWYVALANQKQNMAVHLMTVYGIPELDREFRAMWAAAGKRLDMGKSCVRFRSLEDLHLPAIERAVGACTMAGYVARAKAVTGSAGRAARKAERDTAAKAGAKPARAGAKAVTARPKPNAKPARAAAGAKPEPVRTAARTPRRTPARSAPR